MVESVPVARTANGAEFGDARYISDVVDDLATRTGKSTGEIQEALLQAHRRGDLTLSRADMANAMDQAKIARSEIGYGAAQFHLIKLRNVTDSFELFAEGGQRSSLDGASLFHGTHGKLTPVSTPSTTSLTNELGIGTYLTNDRTLAQQYARAMSSKDTIDIATTQARPKGGRIYPVEIRDTVDIGGVSRPTRIVDVDEERVVWQQVVRDSILDDDISRRFRNRSSPSKGLRGRNFLHYVRSQYIKKYGKDGYASQYSEFIQQLRRNTAAQGIDGYKYGDITNVVNNRALNIGRAAEDVTAEGTINEALLSRYNVDMRMHSDLDNTTTRAILEDDRLDLDVRIQQNMENAVGTQEAATLDVVRRMNEEESALYNANLRALRSEPDDLMQRKIEEVIPQNRNIVRNQGDDCL